MTVGELVESLALVPAGATLAVEWEGESMRVERVIVDVRAMGAQQVVLQQAASLSTGSALLVIEPIDESDVDG